MAAVTVVSSQNSVMGDLRCYLAKVNIATSGDTLNTGLAQVVSLSADGGSAAVTNATASGGTITFTTGGAVTGAWVTAFGY